MNLLRIMYIDLIEVFITSVNKGGNQMWTSQCVKLNFVVS